MPRVLTSPSAGSTIVSPLNISEGGTGATTASGALNNFGAIPANKVNAPLGVAGLDSESKLSPSVLPINEVSTIAISGPSSLVVGQPGTFVITNFDVFTNYQVIAMAGSVSRTGDTITYTAPGASGSSGFSINGKVVNITVNAIQPNQATIISPSEAAQNRNANLTITSSVFSMNYGSDTHQSSDWQLSTDAGFNTIAQSSTDDTTNKTTWVITSLNANTTYYVRTRHKGSSYGYGAWSSGRSFKTKIAFYASNEEGKLIPGDRVANDNVGRYVTISGDGSRIAISASGQDISSVNNAGAVYVFLRTGVSWAQEAKIIASDYADSDSFGHSVCLDTTGVRLAVGAFLKNNGANADVGKVYIYSRSGTTWTEETTLQPSADLTVLKWFGETIDFDENATRVIVGSNGATNSTLNEAGFAYVFSRSGTAWTQEARLAPNDPVASAHFGKSVAMVTDGTRVIIGAYSLANGGFTNAGAVYVFSRSGTAWTQEAKLLPGDPGTNDEFGISVSIDGTATRVIIGAYKKTTASTSQGGCFYIFTRSDVSWTQEAKLEAADTGTAYFGFKVLINKSGTYAYVSSHVHPNNTNLNAGAWYAFVRSGTTWSQISINYANTSYANAYLGVDMDITDDDSRIVVGANGQDNGIAGAGTAFVYA